VKSFSSFHIFKFVFVILFLSQSILIKAQTYELVWSDEFNYTGLPDNSKWNYDVGGDGWGNNELQYYTRARTENTRVENGHLIIQAHKENYGGKAYTSARLITKSKGDWLYGKIEVKAKLPGGTGAWPAIWMLSTDWEYGDWPASGEIDIMEYVGYDPGIVHGTVHTEDYNHMINTQVGRSRQVSDAETTFHVYSLTWTDEKIEIYVDETNYFTFYANSDYKKWPFDKRFHLLLNIAVGGNWGGIEGVEDTIFPIQMEIDYVRVYQDKTVSIKQVENFSTFNIFPNPTNNVLTINSPESFSLIEIYSLHGKKIRTYKTNGNKASEINISSLSNGIYMLKIRTKKNKLIGSKKLIIQ